MALRLTLLVTAEQAAALGDLRDTLHRLGNLALRRARADLHTPVLALLQGLPDADTLPPALLKTLSGPVEQARHTRRGGLKRTGVHLNGQALRVQPDDETVSIWTRQGRVRCGLQLGNYQRHLLRDAGPWRGGTLSVDAAGAWYVRLDPVAAGEHAAPTPPDALNDAERRGQYADVLRLLGRKAPSTPRAQAQQAFAHYQLGQVDEAELALLRLSAQPNADARVWLGLSLLAGERQNHRQRIQHAVRGLEATPEAHIAAWLRCSQSRGHIELGEVTHGVHVAEQALAQVPADDLYARARCLYFLQGAYAAAERFTEQEATAREAMRLFELLGIHRERLALMLDLSYRSFYLNRVPEATELLQRTIALAAEHQDARMAEALLIRAEFGVLQAQFTQALQDLQAVRALEQRAARHRFTVVIQALQAEAHWRAGEWTFETFEETIESLLPLSSFDATVLHFYRGLCQYRRGAPEARASLQQAADGLALMDSFRLRAHAFLLDLQRAQGPLEETHVAPLRTLLDTVGGEPALTLDLDRLAPLYAACAARGLGGRRFERLAQRAGQNHVTLTLQTFGTFAVRVDRTPIRIGLQKAQELLVHLALHGPTRRETLVDALWDGSDRPGVESYFKQAVRTLRTALRAFVPDGEEPIIHQGGQYHLHPCWTVQLDAADVDAASRAHDLRQWQRALALYTGEFLTHSTSEWVQDARLRFHDAALSCALSVGDALLNTQPLAAREAYTRAVDLEPLEERGWQGLLRSLERGDAPHQLDLTRRRYERVFAQELGVTPS
ncbi:transcriptional regulator [Deinococcus maricopensis]|uniref:Response regulator receiver and SARP domain protein n=1 Tax=Deinococcus maricopensis (strain DSM 21211 / LMG 22137 / NRRL B-23946 / LB-34) TaxID=709986 RepID=E8U3U5_DEIML|nr:transcriptional regulator [Deinococcus maricopensis]ADV68788.1 response regulator receiver and SARP domain protein [Deinococcus maricopensis DSM 21211]